MSKVVRVRESVSEIKRVREWMSEVVRVKELGRWFGR